MGTITLTPPPAAPTGLSAVLKAGGSLAQNTEYRFIIQCCNQVYPWTTDFLRSPSSAEVSVTTNLTDLTITLSWNLSIGFGVYDIAYSKDGGATWWPLRASSNGQSFYSKFCSIAGDCSFDFSSEADWPTGQCEPYYYKHSWQDVQGSAYTWMFPSYRIGYGKITLTGNWNSTDNFPVLLKAAFASAGLSDCFVDLGYGFATTFAFYIDPTASGYVHFNGKDIWLYGGTLLNDSPGTFVNMDAVQVNLCGRYIGFSVKNLYCPNAYFTYASVGPLWLFYNAEFYLYRSSIFGGSAGLQSSTSFYFMEPGISVTLGKWNGMLIAFLVPSVTYKTTIKNCSVGQIIVAGGNGDWSPYGLTAYEFRDNTGTSLYMLYANKRIDFYDMNWVDNYGITLADPDRPSIRWDPYGCQLTTFIYLFHWVEITVKDATGATISGAAVLVESAVGVTLLSGTSDVNGKVSGDVLCMKINCTNPSGGLVSNYDDQNPLIYTVSKAGYQTTIVKHSTKRKTWLTIELLDVPAFPSEDDVRDGVTYGIAGELDGDLVLPTEPQVLLGVGFGADAIEFTGELALEIPGASLDVAGGSISVEVTNPSPITLEVT